MATPRPEHAHASATATFKTPPPYPRQQDDGETDVLSSANGPSTVDQQQRCHSTSTSAWSPSWPPMPCPLLHRVATARQEKIQLPIAEQNFLLSSYLEDEAGGRSLVFDLSMTHNLFGSSSNMQQDSLLLHPGPGPQCAFACYCVAQN